MQAVADEPRLSPALVERVLAKLVERETDPDAAVGI